MVQTTPSPLTFVQILASRWITSEESSNPTKALDGRIYAIMAPPNYPSRNNGLIFGPRETNGHKKPRKKALFFKGCIQQPLLWVSQKKNLHPKKYSKKKSLAATILVMKPPPLSLKVTKTHRTGHSN